MLQSVAFFLRTNLIFLLSIFDQKYDEKFRFQLSDEEFSFFLAQLDRPGC